MIISVGPRAGGHCNGGSGDDRDKGGSLSNRGVSGAQGLPT